MDMRKTDILRKDLPFGCCLKKTALYRATWIGDPGKPWLEHFRSNREGIYLGMSFLRDASRYCWLLPYFLVSNVLGAAPTNRLSAAKLILHRLFRRWEQAYRSSYGFIGRRDCAGVSQ